MVLDASAAKALASIIMISTQGISSLRPQLPLQVVDRGDSWLVKGTPYTDPSINSQYCMSHVFIRKDSAEVIGILSEARIILTEEKKSFWSKSMSKIEYERIFGPPTRFEPNGILDIYYALYGGLVNNPADAVEYAHVLMQTKPALATIPTDALQAKEDNTVWHVTARMPGRPGSVEILSFSRNNGKLMSGDL
jgi:hypothetical protein